MPLLRLLLRPSPTLFLCLFASQAGMLVLSPTLPDIAREFGISTATAGQLRSISGATGGLTAVLLALAARRPGLRDLLSAGAALVALGSILSAASPSFGILAAAQAALGVGIGLLVAVGIAAAGEWPAPARRPHVLAWAIAGMPAAWIAGMPVVGLVAGVDWRLAWLAVPSVVALAALGLVRSRPADAPSRRTGDAVAAWRRPDVARFAVGELLANAAWGSVLTYSGALLIGSYGLSPAAVALGLGFTAVAMIPGTFAARRRAAHATPALLTALTTFQAGAVIVLGGVRPATAVTLAVLALMAFANGWRSMVASSLGMDTAPDDKVATMSMRAAANQFGYLLGAAAGGLALALGGFAVLGVTLAAMFLAATLMHLPASAATPVTRPSDGTTPTPRSPMPDHILTIRPATTLDALAVARLVELEEADPLAGEVLLAELDGAVIAAVSLRDDRVVADVFRPTADVARMLRDRREQLIRARQFSHRGSGERPRRIGRLLPLRRAEKPA